MEDNQIVHTADELKFINDKPYRGAIEALMYAAISTRPDIAYAMIRLSRYNNNPGLNQWRAVK